MTAYSNAAEDRREQAEEAFERPLWVVWTDENNVLHAIGPLPADRDEANLVLQLEAPEPGIARVIDDADLADWRENRANEPDPQPFNVIRAKAKKPLTCIASMM